MRSPFVFFQVDTADKGDDTCIVFADKGGKWMIYADDLGWKDVGYQSDGNFKTPILDGLAKNGKKGKGKKDK